MTTTAAATLPRPETDPDSRPLPRRWWMAAMFTGTAFFGAALLFTVQPLVARLLLPSYGGSATVWSTSSLFFQVLLLLGYLYSHWTTRRMGRRRQPWLHLIVLAVPLLTLPLALPASAAPTDQSPVLWLLRTLTVVVGMPFVVLSTTGPLLQRWYSWGDGPRANDPYFMFAASNLGSFGGLLAYPFLIEPHLSLTEQRMLFTRAFVLFVMMTALCAATAFRGRGADETVSMDAPSSTPPPTRRAVVCWAALAFLPSCLMLAVTAHLATDVASIPLLWVAPLALYLATFVAAFARTSRVVQVGWPRAGAALAVCTGATAFVAGGLSIWTLLGLNLALLAVVGYAAHSRLAVSRPAPEHLTTFYLVIALGGAAGGLVNGLIAPVLFDRVLEYPLALAAVPLLLLGLQHRDRTRFEIRYGRWVVTAVAFVFVTMVLSIGPAFLLGVRGAFQPVTVLALVALVGWIAYRRPGGLVAGMLTAMVLLDSSAGHDVIARDRTFYGSYEVSEDAARRALRHGTTLHGFQLQESPTTPTSYYARSGPLGDIMETVQPRLSGVVGLGTGTIAAYGRPGDEITFYEIDQAVVDVASDPTYFTFLRDTSAAVDVRVGDGRLLLESEPAGGFDLLVLDAFSSDAIPVHLLTHEAFALYASRVDPRGAIAVHVSNRVFDLAPVTTSAADHVGWSALSASGGEGPSARPSTWVLLTPNDELVDRLVGWGWQPLAERDGVAWTDDYSSVLDVLK